MSDEEEFTGVETGEATDEMGDMDGGECRGVHGLMRILRCHAPKQDDDQL